MSTEPDHPIGEQLQDWAAARRDPAGPPFELHPVNRRSLHEELARQTWLESDRSAQSRSAFAWWPRLALAGGLALLLLLAISQLGPSSTSTHGTMDLAQVRSDPESQPTAAAAQSEETLALKSEALAPALAVPPADPEALAVAQPAPTDTAAPTMQPTAAPAPARSRAPAPGSPQPAMPEERAFAGTADRGTRAETDAYRVAEVGQAPAGLVSQPIPLAEIPPTLQAPAATALLDAADDGSAAKRADVAGAGTRFVQTRVYRRNVNSPPRTVLQSFQIVRDGNRVQVTDADGSVYEGTLLVPGAGTGIDNTMSPAAPFVETDRAPVQLRQRNGLAAAPAAAAPGVPTFQVSGTNRTTGERVVFVASWSGAPEERIRGQARVGANTRLGIDAAPAP